jgi:hypothetical protein
MEITKNSTKKNHAKVSHGPNGVGKTHVASKAKDSKAKKPSGIKSNNHRRELLDLFDRPRLEKSGF